MSFSESVKFALATSSSLNGIHALLQGSEETAIDEALLCTELAKGREN